MEIPLFGDNPVERGVNDASRDAVLARIAGDAGGGAGLLRGSRVIASGPHAGDGRRNPFKDDLIVNIQLTAADGPDRLVRADRTGSPHAR